MNTLSYGAILAAVLQLVKQTEVIPSRFMGIVALVAGVGMGYALGLGFMEGITMGLSSMGVYETSKVAVTETKSLINKTK